MRRTIITAYVLDPILVDAAERAGADVRFGVTVSGVKRNYKGRVTGIVGRDEKGQGVSFDAGLVIGADGARSTIAQRVGAPIVRFGTSSAAVVYGYWRDLEPEGDEAGYEWNFRPGAGAGVIPTNNGESCVFVGGPPSRVGTGGERVMQEMLRDASPSLAARVAAATAPLGVRTFMGRARASCDGRGDRGGRSSAMRATGRTRSARTASPTRCATPSCSPAPSSRPATGASRSTPPSVATKRPATASRSGCSTSPTRSASFTWSNEEIGPLLYEMSGSMSDEVDAIAALDEAAVGC